MTASRTPATSAEQVAAFNESLAQLNLATETLLEVAARMRPGQENDATVLPGWTLGHLLTHLARNADAVRNLTVWASSGVETPMYPSQQSRDEEIQAGAARGRDELLDDLSTSAADLQTDLGAMPPSALSTNVRLRNGRELPGRSLPYLRTQELYIHLIDLGLGYTPADWPEDFVATALRRVSRNRADADDLPVGTLKSEVDGTEWRVGAGGLTIVGSPAALLEWLTGRGDTTQLTTASGEPVPAPVAW
jgi:maleylpyruvate isomerase